MLYGLEAYDWTLANHDSKMVLYHFTRNLADNGLIDKKMDRFIEEALKDYGGSAASVKDGFRKGRAGSDKMAMIARHIGRRFPERVPVLIEQLQPVWPQTSNHDYWEDFIGINGTFSNVNVLKCDRQTGLNIATFANREPIADLKLKLGDGFCFRVDSPVNGYAFAMQSVNNAWFKLPLSPASPDIEISQGEQLIPVDPATGDVHPLWEEHNTGLHKFVFVVAEDQNILECAKRLAVSEPIRQTELKQLAKDLSNLDGEWAMLRMNVIVV